MTKRYATLNGIKRAAIKLKRRMGMSHSHALEQIAREAGHPDYFSARQAYTGHPAPFRDEEWLGDEAFEPATEEPPVEIIEMSPELSALLKRQRDLDIADAVHRASGPQELRAQDRLDDDVLVALRIGLVEVGRDRRHVDLEGLAFRGDEGIGKDGSQD